MVDYILAVRIPNAGNKEITYKASLSSNYASYPEDYFRRNEHRQALQDFIQQQSARTLTKVDLDGIINQWIQDIRSGIPNTTVTLHLPAVTSSGSSVPSAAIPSATPAPPPFRPKKPDDWVVKTADRSISPSPVPSPQSTPSPAPTPIPDSAPKSSPLPPPNLSPDSNDATPPPPDNRVNTNRKEF